MQHCNILCKTDAFPTWNDEYVKREMKVSY